MLFDTRSRSAHKNTRLLELGFIRLTARDKHTSEFGELSTPSKRLKPTEPLSSDTRGMTLAKALLSLVITSLLGPSTSMSQALFTLPFESASIVNQYLAPMTEYSSGHRGIDLSAELGSEVLAPTDGVLSFVGKVGYRNVISVQFGDSMTVSIEPVCSDLVEGQPIYKDESLGLVCAGDLEYQWHCETTCIHIGTRNHLGYFSPLALTGGLKPSRLVSYARG